MSDGEAAKAPTEDAVVRGEDGVARCRWAGVASDYRPYHDTQWGFPVADDTRLFEKLSLEGFQADSRDESTCCRSGACARRAE